MFNRPTSMAAAFVTAACKMQGVDPDKGKGNWVARRTIINAGRPGFAVVTERDHSPPRPNTHVMAVVTKPTTEVLRAEGMDICDDLQVSRGLYDAEVEGID